MVRFSDEWREWIEDELEQLDLDELEELAWLLGAGLLHEDTPARMLVRRSDDPET